jgi:AcrR family transcriptional regulator
MARPAVIQDSDILEAAREVFLNRGFRATTAEVAARAGVSEGSIFKRFKSKFELFQAAVGSLDATPACIDALPARVGLGDLRATLVEVGRELASHMREVVPLHLLAFSNPGPDGAPPHLNGGKPAPIRTLEALTQFFDAEMRANRLVQCDPEIVARTFVGGIHNYVILDLLFQAHEEPMPEETFLHGLVDVLFRGVEPSRPAPTRERS